MSDNWSIEAAATAMGMDRRTLAKRLREAGVETGRGVSFTTKQLFSAVIERSEKMLTRDEEQARLAKEKADEIAMRNATKRKEMLDVAQFCKRADPIITGMIARIESSSLKDVDKDALRADLEKLCDAEFLKGAND